jgi:hypothetical protein
MATDPQIKTGQLRPPKAPNLPNAPREGYNFSYFDQYSNVLRLYFNQIDNFAQPFTNQIGYDESYVEAYDRTASIAIASTPTLLKPASFLPATVSGITYDPATGVFTFNYAGTYSLSVALNITTTRGNQTVYVYAQKNVGTGWTNTTNSGKQYQLTNGSTVQFNSSQSVYRVAGEQTRYYIYSNDVYSTLVTQTLPTVTPSVYVPAVRIQFS